MIRAEFLTVTVVAGRINLNLEILVMEPSQEAIA